MVLEIDEDFKRLLRDCHVIGNAFCSGLIRRDDRSDVEDFYLLSDECFFDRSDRLQELKKKCFQPVLSTNLAKNVAPVAQKLCEISSRLEHDFLSGLSDTESFKAFSRGQQAFALKLAKNSLSLYESGDNGKEFSQVATKALNDSRVYRLALLADSYANLSEALAVETSKCKKNNRPCPPKDFSDVSGWRKWASKFKPPERLLEISRARSVVNLAYFINNLSRFGVKDEDLKDQLLCLKAWGELSLKQRKDFLSKALLNSQLEKS